MNNNFGRCSICDRPGIIIKVGEKDLCIKHFRQFRKYGKFLDKNPRRKSDKNSYHIYGNISHIDLYDDKCNLIAQTVIDTEDLYRVKDIKWDVSPFGDVISFDNNSCIILPNIILNVPSDKIIVDHINNDLLDNRKDNLIIK